MYYPAHREVVLAFFSVAAVSFAPTSAFSQDCPDYSGPPAYTFSVTSSNLYNQSRIPIRAGGDIDLGQCISAPGHGYVQKAPDVRIEYDAEDLSRRLDIGIVGDCDTVVLINLPDGNYLFMDDVEGDVDPIMQLESAASGVYDIWVGTYSSGFCPSTLTLETF